MFLWRCLRRPSRFSVLLVPLELFRPGHGGGHLLGVGRGGLGRRKSGAWLREQRSGKCQHQSHRRKAVTRFHGNALRVTTDLLDQVLLDAHLGDGSPDEKQCQFRADIHKPSEPTAVSPMIPETMKQELGGLKDLMLGTTEVKRAARESRTFAMERRIVTSSGRVRRIGEVASTFRNASGLASRREIPGVRGATSKRELFLAAERLISGLVADPPVPYYDRLQLEYGNYYDSIV